MRHSTIHTLSKEDCEKILTDINDEKTKLEYKLSAARLQYRKKLLAIPEYERTAVVILEEMNKIKLEWSEEIGGLVPEDDYLRLQRLRLHYDELLKRLRNSGGTAMVKLEFRIIRLQTELDVIDDFIKMVKQRKRVLEQN